jgi:hypothetical protein
MALMVFREMVSYKGIPIFSDRRVALFFRQISGAYIKLA